MNGCKLELFDLAPENTEGEQLLQLPCPSSDPHGIDGHYTEECSVTVLNRDQTVMLGVPEGGGSSLKTSTVILQENARYGVLEWLIELVEILNTALNDLLAPVVHLVLLVRDTVLRLSLHNTLNGERGDVLHLLVVELHFLVESLHFISKKYSNY